MSRGNGWCSAECTGAESPSAAKCCRSFGGSGHMQMSVLAFRAGCRHLRANNSMLLDFAMADMSSCPNVQDLAQENCGGGVIQNWCGSHGKLGKFWEKPAKPHQAPKLLQTDRKEVMKPNQQVDKHESVAANPASCTRNGVLIIY